MVEVGDNSDAVSVTTAATMADGQDAPEPVV